MKKKKVIQINTVKGDDGLNIIALGSDGSIWQMFVPDSAVCFEGESDEKDWISIKLPPLNKK